MQVVTDEPLGSHVLELQLADVVEETADARSLVFTAPDGADIPPERLRYSPGQFLTLRVPSDRTGSVARCYSLCSSPFTGDPLTVTVKRTEDGYASNWLCDNAHAGMKMHVLAPSGTFVPKTLDTDFLLLGGRQRYHADDVDLQVGAGRGQRQGRPGLRQSGRELGDLRRRPARTGGQVPGSADRRALARQRAGAPERGGAGRPGRALFRTRRIYLRSGPVHGRGRGSAQGRRAERIHIEVFKSLDSDPFAAVVIEEDDSDEGPATAIVTLDGEKHEITWPRNAKLLDVLLDKGLDAPFSCREGHCGACAVLKKTGDVEMEINDVLEQSDLDEGLILGCQAKPRSDSVEVTYDE